MSAIIGGFLFTGISVMISAIENKRIKRLWENNYIDNLYHSAFIGIIGDVLTIVAALISLCIVHTKEVGRLLIKVEIGTLITSLVFFVWCVKYLVFIKSYKVDNYDK